MAKERIDRQVREMLLARGSAAPSREQKLELARSLRTCSAETQRQLDEFFVDALQGEQDAREAFARALKDSHVRIEKLGGLVEKLTTGAWYPGVFIGSVLTARGELAIVFHAGRRRVVGLGEGLELGALKRGDEVFLNCEQNIVMARSPAGPPGCGETAVFDRRNGERMIVKQRDEEFVCDVAAGLAGATLAPGDQVRWSRDCAMAFERLEKADARRLLLEEVPEIGPERVGGQDANLDEVLSALAAILLHREEAAALGLRERVTIMMEGPPGCGKTLIARIASSVFGRTYGVKVFFGIVRPGEWFSPWVGVSQQNIGEFFQAAREASRDGFVVIYLDEVETIGRRRGGLASRHADECLGRLLSEIDGFRGLNRVAVISSTNRKDLLDEALRQRLSDIELHVGRPDQQGARAIFGVHLAPSLVYNPNGRDAAATREEIIETAVSMLYSPNADNGLAVLRMRDRTERKVAARDLVSGRIIEQICQGASRAAVRRKVRGGAYGIECADVVGAVEQAIGQMRTTLTPENAHEHLPGLPRDVDVLHVEPVRRKARVLESVDMRVA